MPPGLRHRKISERKIFHIKRTSIGNVTKLSFQSDKISTDLSPILQHNEKLIFEKKSTC
jgi:hypothetical protein